MAEMGMTEPKKVLINENASIIIWPVSNVSPKGSSLRGNVHLVSIEGEVDAHASSAIKKILLDKAEDLRSNDFLIIHMNRDTVEWTSCHPHTTAGLDYIDASGLGILIAIIKKLDESRTRESNLILTMNNPAIIKVFDITGLINIFEIFYDLQTALDYLV